MKILTIHLIITIASAKLYCQSHHWQILLLFPPHKSLCPQTNERKQFAVLTRSPNFSNRLVNINNTTQQTFTSFRVGYQLLNAILLYNRQQTTMWKIVLRLRPHLIPPAKTINNKTQTCTFYLYDSSVCLIYMRKMVENAVMLVVINPHDFCVHAFLYLKRQKRKGPPTRFVSCRVICETIRAVNNVYGCLTNNSNLL